MSRRPAAFLDRDGTIIRDAMFVSGPDTVELLPGSAEAIRRLNERGVAVIVVTNQSGIARGLLGLADYEAVRKRLDVLLASESLPGSRVPGEPAGRPAARIDASYMCPHHPDVSGPCDCRKPGLALYRQAIAEHGLDVTHSVFIGDRWRDVAPASVLGGLPILLDVESTPDEDRARAVVESIATAASLADAVDRFARYLDALETAPGR